MRFTLLSLFIAMGMAALACAGLMNRTHWWAEGIATFTVALYAFVGIRAFSLHGRDRAFAIAFATIGSAYLLLVALPAREWLITNYPMALAVRTFNQQDLTLQIPPTGHSGYSFAWPIGEYSVKELPYEWVLIGASSNIDTTSPIGAFFLIGHCVWSWLLALISGWFAGRLYAKREKLQKTSVGVV